MLLWYIEINRNVIRTRRKQIDAKIHHTTTDSHTKYQYNRTMEKNACYKNSPSTKSEADVIAATACKSVLTNGIMSWYRTLSIKLSLFFFYFLWRTVKNHFCMHQIKKMLFFRMMKMEIKSVYCYSKLLRLTNVQKKSLNFFSKFFQFFFALLIKKLHTKKN